MLLLKVVLGLEYPILRFPTRSVNFECLGPPELLLEGLDFPQPPHVTLFVSEVRGQKGANDVLSELLGNDPRSHDQDVHVVMLDALMAGVGVMADAGADAFDFVGGHADSDTAAADEDAALGAAIEHGAADQFGAPVGSR